MRADELRGAAQRMYDTAGTGQFRMSQDAARRLSSACDVLLEGLRRARGEGNDLTRVHGFPDLPSGRALTTAFGTKGATYLEVLAGLEESALRMKAGYLAAGSLTAEADAAHRVALERATERIGDEG